MSLIRGRSVFFLSSALLVGALVTPVSAQKRAPESLQQEAAWRASQPWTAFKARQGSDWHVEWSEPTATPKAIWGQGIPLQDWRENSLEEARRHAYQLLDEHADLLGLGESTFREVIGARMHKVWVFKFQQYYRDIEVIGGRADVRVHMVGRVPMIGSTFWPIPGDFDTTPAFDAGAAWVFAWQALAAAPSDATQPAPVAPPRLVIWGDIGAKSPVAVQLAWEVPVSNVDRQGNGPIGRYYIGARKGDVLHFENDKHECGLAGCRLGDPATLVGHVAPVDRVESALVLPIPVSTTVTVMSWTNTGVDAYSPIANVPLPGLQVSVPGIGVVATDANGQFSINIATATTISLAGLDGRHHQAIIGGSAPSGAWVVNPGQAMTIQLLSPSATTDQLAHPNTSYWIDATNELSRSILGNTSQLATASNIAVRVNIASTCNAYYVGNSINFYSAGGGCANTSFSTVVAHEWGHGLDDRYGGISQTDGLSEGWGDILGCYLLDTPDIGRSFRADRLPLRSGNNTEQYPCFACGVHTAGQSWMGFAWKLRNRLATTLGNRPAAIALSKDIVIGSIVADATDQVAAVREVFIADDNDGNLSNGTPHYNDLVWACNQHSLPYPGQTTNTPGDECATAIALTNGLSATFSSVGATTSSPAWPCGSAGNDVWFSYTATQAGMLTVSACNYASWDTVVQVFTGSCGSLSSVDCNDDACGLQSTVTTPVSAGVYHIRVGGYGGAQGAFRLNVYHMASTSVPATPQNLAVSAVTASSVSLSWVDVANNELQYRVARLDPGEDPNNPAHWDSVGVLTANATSFVAGGLVPWATYRFKVRCSNQAGYSGYSNIVTGTTGTAPAMPQNLAVTAVSASTVSLAWVDAANDETEYRVARLDPGEDPNNPSLWDNVGVLSANATSFVAGGLAAGATYRFKVRCSNQAGYSGYSNIVQGTTSCSTPSSPSGLWFPSICTGEVTLQWTDNASDEQGYRVARLDPGEDPNNPAHWDNVSGDLPANTTQFVATDLTSGGVYQFKVRAYNACGFSAYSPAVAVTILATPGTPANCVAARVQNTPNVADPVRITWTYSGAPVSGFRIARLDPGEDPNNAAQWDNIGGNLPPGLFSFTDSTPTLAGQTYSYKVRAFLDTPCGRVYGLYSNIDGANP